MKVTSKQLLELFGLKVGDRIKFTLEKYNQTKSLEGEVIVIVSGDIMLRVENGKKPLLDISRLVNTDYEIIPSKKKVGELVCAEVKCSSCPLSICCQLTSCPEKLTLYDYFNIVVKEQHTSEDNLIYKAIKAELDKEVEE